MTTQELILSLWNSPKSEYVAAHNENFFSRDKVRSMSREEVRENYHAILESMKKW